MQAGKVRFLRAIICEDVRFEVDGRLSLMGALAGELVFSPEKPTSEGPKIDLAFYVECEISESVTVSFRFLAPDGETVLSEMSGEFSKVDGSDEATRAAVPVKRKTFELTDSGSYAFQAREDEGEWLTLNHLQVNILMPELDDDIQSDHS